MDDYFETGVDVVLGWWFQYLTTCPCNCCRQVLYESFNITDVNILQCNLIPMIFCQMVNQSVESSLDSNSSLFQFVCGNQLYILYQIDIRFFRCKSVFVVEQFDRSPGFDCNCQSECLFVFESVCFWSVPEWDTDAKIRTDVFLWNKCRGRGILLIGLLSCVILWLLFLSYAIILKFIDYIRGKQNDSILPQLFSIFRVTSK